MGVVAAGGAMHRGRPGEGALFEGEVGMEVDLGGFHLLVTQPESDDRGIHTRVQQSHGGRVPQHVQRNRFLVESRTRANRASHRRGKPTLQRVAAERLPRPRCEERIVCLTATLGEPDAQHCDY